MPASAAFCDPKPFDDEAGSAAAERQIPEE
jgi:hypothetical protein